MKKIKSRGEIATTLTLGAVILMLLGTVFGVKLATRPQTTSSFAAEGVNILPNNDVTAELQTPRVDRTWDYILSGSLCFAFTPPSANAQYRVEIVQGDDIIGASVYQLITAPATAKCGGRNLTFSAPFNLKAGSSCPDLKIRIETRGAWPNFNREIGALDSGFFCPNRPTPPAGGTPTRSPEILTPDPVETIAPTRGFVVVPIPSGAFRATTGIPVATRPIGPAVTLIQANPFPTLAESRITGVPVAPVPYGASGTVSLYSCGVPNTVNLKYCDDAAGSSCTTLPYVNTPSDQGIWLDDESSDRAQIYRYRITKKVSGETLNPSESVYIQGASATISNIVFPSAAESKQQVRYGQTLDLTIFAEEKTCTCNFQSTTYVKNSAGESIRKYDLGLPQFGTANDKQRAKLGDRPQVQFVGGQIIVPPTDLIASSSPESYGRDHIATVKLYHDNSHIEKLVCDSRAGSVPACPGEKWQWEGRAGSVDDLKVFPGLRVTCDANIEYGWVIDTSVLSIDGLQIPIGRLDLNNDGVINTIDYQEVLEVYLQSGGNLPPDFNGDRVVNAVDLSMIISRIGDSVE